MSAGKGKAAAGKGKAKAATGISAVHVIISVQCVNFSRQAVFLGVLMVCVAWPWLQRQPFCSLLLIAFDVILAASGCTWLD